MTALALVMHLDGRQARPEDLAPMLTELERRGPEGASSSYDASVALGARLLATTPEALCEPMPYYHDPTGCRLVGQIRLDNRDDLLARFGLAQSGRIIGDGELVVRAWLAWGEGCAESFLGDFAFALWDPRQACVFAARDQLGMRQLIYAHRPGRLFACASSARAVALAPGLLPELNDLRLAEALVDFEWGSLTSTFFEDVYRLQPGHALRVDRQGLRLWAYWQMTPPPPLRLRDHREYAEAFRETLALAVQCRLRGAGAVGSMLSGGMDSGSVVALACRMQPDPLATFSAVGPDPANCVETGAVHHACTLPNIRPTLIDYSNLGAWKDDLIAAWLALEEPWDFHMTVPRVAYLAAQRSGVKVVLDGVAGDVVLGHGSQMARQIKAGQILRAFRDARGLSAFYGLGMRDTLGHLSLAARAAFAPAFARKLRSAWRRRFVQPLPKDGLIAEDYAERVGLITSLRLDRTLERPAGMSFPEERIWAWSRSGLVVGRERYDRVAGYFGVEPRDPYMDQRVLRFCLSLPVDQLQADGWPKLIQRRSMEGLLPDAVRWRTGKEHLGWTFTQKLIDQWQDWRVPLQAAREPLLSRVKTELHGELGEDAGLVQTKDTLLQTALFLGRALPSSRIPKP